jgi:hypothetical protein
MGLRLSDAAHGDANSACARQFAAANANGALAPGARLGARRWALLRWTASSIYRSRTMTGVRSRQLT